MRRSLLLVLTVLLVLTLATSGRSADDGAALVTALKRGLRKDDATERMAVLTRARRAGSDLAPRRRRAAAVAIRSALKGERNAAVRGEMVRTLAALGGSTGWIGVLLVSRDARDADLAHAARMELLGSGGDFLDVVARLLEEDEDPTFRADLLLVLGDRRRLDAVPLLLGALAADHTRVRAAAAEALEAITGEAFGYDAAAWGRWWESPGARPTPTSPDAGTGTGETVTTPEAARVVKEPPPHVTRSLVPEFYGLPVRGKHIVFVIDVSGSVGASGVGRIKRELVDVVEALGSDVQVAALFFDEQVRMWRPGMVRATPAHKAELAHFLRGIQPGRKTDVFTPLNAGLAIVRRRLAALEAAGEPVREAVAMYVVSDGVETRRQTPPSVVAEKLDRLDASRTVVHAIDLGVRGSRLLMNLARLGGGHYVRAK